MPTHLLALVSSMVLALADVPGAKTAVLLPTHAGARAPLGSPGALRTDHLSPKKRRVWIRIIPVVMAEGPDHYPLHPTLRRLWDTVDTSGHVVDVEMS